jgi:hypothetical protein
MLFADTVTAILKCGSSVMTIAGDEDKNKTNKRGKKYSFHILTACSRYKLFNAKKAWAGCNFQKNLS